jgi:2'-5' RNA ligase
VFVGLKIMPAIAIELAQVAGELAQLPVRLVPSADIHLTLVPPWNEESIPDAISKLGLVAAQCSAFELNIQRIGYGPEPRRPRLLWADCEVSDGLVMLRTALSEAYGNRDERPFRPHLTLARIRGNGAAIARKHPMGRAVTMTQQVDSIELFQSPPPGERGYRVLASAHLGESPALQ